MTAASEPQQPDEARRFRPHDVPPSAAELREQATAEWLWEHDEGQFSAHFGEDGEHHARYIDMARDLLDREELFPSPQQPPAQERGRRCGCGATGPCSCREDWAPGPAVLPASPSEADSADEDEDDVDLSDIVVPLAPPDRTGRIVWDDEEPPDCGHRSWAGLMQLLDHHWPDDIWPTLHHDDLARDTGARLISLLRWVDQLRAQLAASPGVQGEDGEARLRADLKELWLYLACEAEISSFPLSFGYRDAADRLHRALCAGEHPDGSVEG